MTKTKATLLLPLLISGCTARVFGGPPPPATARPLDRDEVVSIAMNYSASRGYQCRVKEIEREGHQWQVHLAVAPPLRGEIEMKIDGWSGEILKAHEEVKSREHRRRREHDDEDEHDD